MLVVALRKESVDRNIESNKNQTFDDLSLSARRAWIEIIFVANPIPKLWSLSARRAWIEIHTLALQSIKALSLSARRAWIEILLVL